MSSRGSSKGSSNNSSATSQTPTNIGGTQSVQLKDKMDIKPNLPVNVPVYAKQEVGSQTVRDTKEKKKKEEGK